MTHFETIDIGDVFLEIWIEKIDVKNDKFFLIRLIKFGRSHQKTL